MKFGTATTFADGKLVYHNTVVCEALPNGRTRLNSGGWRTATTKKRMNQYAEMMGFSWRVRQIDFDWFIWRVDGHDSPYTEFFDGMEV
jgi:hypothetical protein